MTLWVFELVDYLLEVTFFLEKLDTLLCLDELSIEVLRDLGAVLRVLAQVDLDLDVLQSDRVLLLIDLEMKLHGLLINDQHPTNDPLLLLIQDTC